MIEHPPEFYILKAEQYELIGKFEEALECYRLALECFKHSNELGQVKTMVRVSRKVGVPSAESLNPNLHF